MICLTLLLSESEVRAVQVLRPVSKKTLAHKSPFIGRAPGAVEAEAKALSKETKISAANSRGSLEL